MRKRSSMARDESSKQDPETTAVELSLEEHKKNPAAVSLGRLGGLKGGKARAANMTQQQRSDAARTAVQARWAKSCRP